MKIGLSTYDPLPEVRLKKYLEIRWIDQPRQNSCFRCQPYAKAFSTRMIRLGCGISSKMWSWEERVRAYYDSHQQALGARVHGISTDLAKELPLISGRTATSQSVTMLERMKPST
jgi:hypothetical protein